MTLVLSCVTPDYVFQVSDRRLVWISGSNQGQVADEERNKAVLIDGRFAFGYTGLAEVGSQRTDDWLARIVSDGSTRNMSEVLARIRDRATEDFRQIALPASLKRHAFQGVGWVFEGDTQNPIPGIVTATNSFDSDGRWLPMAEDAFASRYSLFHSLPDGFELRGVGQEITGNEQAAIWRFVRRSARRAAPPGAFLRGLIESVLWLSRRYSTIGASLMALCIPKRAAQRSTTTGQMMALMGGPIEDCATFLYVSSNGQPTTFYGPHVVTASSMMLNFTVRPADPAA